MEKVIREVILKRTIDDTGASEDIAEKVISWSYRKANEASRSYKNIELSGIGVFKVSPSKAAKKIRSLERMVELLEDRIAHGQGNREADEKKIEGCKEAINYCLSKLSDEDRVKQNIGGIDESSISP